MVPAQHGDDALWIGVAQTDQEAPLCVRQLLALPPPDGSSNLPLINLLAYWRQIGLREIDAIGRAAAWLLRGAADPTKRAERWGSANSVGRAVYAHGYGFARHYIEPLRVVTAADCAACPLYARCATGED